MAATNMFEPGWILINFHWGSSRGHKTIQSSPAQTHSHFLWDAKLPYNSCVQTINFFSISNFHGGYIYVWAGLNPDWFHWWSSRGHKTIQSARLRPIPIFYGTPNFPIFLNQTINFSPSQTSMAATYMFEPGWFLIDFIDDRLGDTKQFNPANFGSYLFPPFPSMERQTSLISLCSTINSSPSQTSMAATNMFEPGWFLIGFIEDRLGDTKQTSLSILQPGSDPFPFSMGRQTSL